MAQVLHLAAVAAVQAERDLMVQALQTRVLAEAEVLVDSSVVTLVAERVVRTGEEKLVEPEVKTLVTVVEVEMETLLQVDLVARVL